MCIDLKKTTLMKEKPFCLTSELQTLVLTKANACELSVDFHFDISIMTLNARCLVVCLL